VEDGTSAAPHRPRWVRLAIPVATAKRRDVLRNAVTMTVLTVLWAAPTIALAFVDEGSRLHSLRWWVLAFFALAGVGLGAEFRAIRWTDRAGLWQR
jgi:hypothetical protein